jgi:hypothetical protein
MLARILSKLDRSAGGADKYPDLPEDQQSSSRAQSGRSGAGPLCNGGGGTGVRSTSVRSVCSSGKQPSTRGGVKTVDPSTTTWSTARKASVVGLAEEEALLVEIDGAEEDARKFAEHGTTYSFVMSTIASMKVFLTHLITINSVFGVSLTTGATLWVWLATEDTPSQFLGAMDWALLGFAIVLPLSAIVRFAFVRRERALSSIMDIKSNAMYIYLAHATWDWDEGKGRAKSAKNFLKHSDNALEELILIADELCRYLTLPTSSHAHHKELGKGRAEAAMTMKAMYLLFDSIVSTRVSRLTIMVEQLKAEGLAATECTRIRQFERYMVRSIEELRAIKTYRTPLALRAFANIFTLLIPPFYAPSYVQIAYDMNSLAIGIMFGIITSLALTGLYESVDVLEDPFVASLTLDGIDVHEELSVLYWKTLTNARSVAFPDAAPLGEAAEDNPAEEMALDVSNHTNGHNRSSFRAKRPSIYELRNSSRGTSSRSMRNLFASFDNGDREDQLQRTEKFTRSDGVGVRKSCYDRTLQGSALSRPLPRIPSVDDDDDNDNNSDVGQTGGVGRPTESLPHSLGDEHIPRLLGFDNATEDHVLGMAENAAGSSKSDDELDDYFVEND